MSPLIMTGTQWLAMASKRGFDEGVSRAMLSQNLEDCIPRPALVIPSFWTLPKTLLERAGLFVFEGDINDSALLKKLFDVVAFHACNAPGCSSRC